MQLTPKQTELLRVIAAANTDGSHADLDQIIERVSYKPTKQSIQFSIRALVKHGLIEKTGEEKRRDRRRVLIGVTELGKHFSGPRYSVGIVSTVGAEEIDESIELIEL